MTPKKVESVISEMKGVQETAVVGIPDEVLGQAIKAYIVRSDPALTEKEVRKHCAARLENYMVPQFVEFVPELRKIDKKVL